MLLGVEIMRRLGCPALVLAPNSAIQSQWVPRTAGWRAVSSDGGSPVVGCLTVAEGLEEVGLPR